jgi:hypothetical protein
MMNISPDLSKTERSAANHTLIGGAVFLCCL